MLKALTEDGDYIMADNAIKKGRYLCPECEDVVTFKAGRIVVPHFAHKPPHHFAYGTGESARHHEMKVILGKLFAEYDPEYEIALLDYRRADIVLVKPRIVIECQAPKIGVYEWEQRTRDYNAAGWGVMWIWDFKRFGKPVYDEYRVPDEIRFCHQEQYGRVYVLNVRHFYGVHMYAMKRHTEWEDGYDYYPKTLRNLIRKELPTPLAPRKTRSASGLLIANFGEEVWWQKSA